MTAIILDTNAGTIEWVYCARLNSVKHQFLSPAVTSMVIICANAFNNHWVETNA